MGYKTIVCGVTGSAHAQKAALEAAMMAKRDNARLVFVYAVDASFLKGGSNVGMTHGDVEKSLEQLGKHILDHAEQIALTQGVTPKKVLKVGAVLEAIKAVMAEEKGDLLVIGHEKRTAFEKVLVGGEVEDHVEELRKQTGAEVSVVK